MKSLNTKKIVAMATGAALLGSALLGAVSYQNTELINDNGVPMAKIVVGSNAQISDGVAAANIAAVLGNMAFKKVTVTPTVDGVSGLKCDVSGEGAGTCAVLSKSVDLEVVTPAGVIPAGAYGINVYSWDYIDSNTKDRSPGNYKKIKGSEFSPLNDYPISDTQSSYSAVEKQFIEVKSGIVRFLGDGDDEIFKAEAVDLKYSIEFEDPYLPVCTDDYDTLNCSSTDKLDNHRVKIKFLGEEWIVSEIHHDGTYVDYIKLASESAYSPKLQIGEKLDLKDGNFLILGDLKPASGGQKEDVAIFSVVNAADEEIASQVVDAGKTANIKAGKNTYRIKVYQVAPGYTMSEKWAEVAVFGNELKLENGGELSDQGNDITWDVDFDLIGTYNQKIRKIILDREITDLEVGDSFDIVENPTIWRFTFTGLDLNENDYERVRVRQEITSTSTKFYNCTGVGDYSKKGDCEELSFGVNALIKFTADSNIFKFTDPILDDDMEVKEILVAPFTVGTDVTKGDIFYKNSKNFYVPIKNVALGAPFNKVVKYYDGKEDLSIYIDITSADGLKIHFEENIDDPLTGNHKIGFGVIQNPTGSSTRWIIDADLNKDTENDRKSFLVGPLGNVPAEVDKIAYTARGSYITNVGASSFDFYMAKDVGELVFLLQATGASVTEEGVVPHNLKEGETINVLGATIKVKNINCDVGPCTAAGGEGTVTGIEGLTCKLNVNTANLGERQDIPTDLVVMDKNAVNVETVISVGGPMVNIVTEGLLAGESPLVGAGDSIVLEVASGKIVVAGYTADDTLDAAQKFIANLKGQ